jgi:hypothetical protein
VSKRKKRLGVSKGEQKIKTYLLSAGIDFKAEKTFDTLVNKNTGHNLYFDYYLPEYNTVIEYDGYQHYTYKNKYHNNKSDFVKQKLRDAVKDKWCEDNNVNLLRIGFYDYKNVYNILSNALTDNEKPKNCDKE